jgi:cellulose synthase/poly-beta-1,6-N-acetylglucosamine synthase-like glycosyltransferase
VEIIVVDDGSRDGTLAVASKYAGVRVVSQSRNMGPAAARNRGAQEARGEIILFTDADCVPGENWVADMVGSFENDPGVTGVKGVYRTRQRDLTARFVQLEFEFKYERMKQQDRIFFIDTYSAGYRRQIFLESGGFDTGFPVASTEDIELSFRLAAKGYRMVFNPRAYVYHQHPASWIDYMKRKFKYAYWGAVVMRRYPNKALNDSYTPITQKVQLMLVPIGMVALGLSFLHSTIWRWGAVAVWLSIGLSMLPFAALSLRKDWLATLASPLFLVPRALVQSLAVVAGAMRPLRSSARSAGA